MNTVLIACIAGFFCGWASAVSAAVVLRDKPEPKQLPQAEPRAEPEKAAETLGWDQNTMKQMLDLLNYDGRGGDDDRN